MSDLKWLSSKFGFVYLFNHNAYKCSPIINNTEENKYVQISE